MLIHFYFRLFIDEKGYVFNLPLRGRRFSARIELKTFNQDQSLTVHEIIPVLVNFKLYIVFKCAN